MTAALRTLSLATLVALAAAPSQAADYTYSVPTKVTVQGAFDDTYAFTPTADGTYSFTYTVVNVNGGCATRFCHSKWSIHTQVTSFYLTDGTTFWVPPYGGVTAPLLAGVTYSLHIAGVGYGTGAYAGQGAYTVTVTKGY